LDTGAAFAAGAALPDLLEDAGFIVFLVVISVRSFLLAWPTTDDEREARKEGPPRGFAGRCLPFNSAFRDSGRRARLLAPVSRRLLPIPTFSLSRNSSCGNVTRKSGKIKARQAVKHYFVYATNYTKCRESYQNVQFQGYSTATFDLPSTQNWGKP